MHRRRSLLGKLGIYGLAIRNMQNLDDTWLIATFAFASNTSLISTECFQELVRHRAIK